MAAVIEHAAVVAAASQHIEQAQAFTITDADSYRRVAEFLQGIKALRAEIAATFDPHIKHALAMVPTAAVPSSTPKIAGVRFNERWSAKVTSLPALIAHVAAHPQLMALLVPNMVALNQQARSLRGQLQIPGVTAVCTKDVAASAARTPAP
jgi:hypothetical protein